MLTRPAIIVPLFIKEPIIIVHYSWDTRKHVDPAGTSRGHDLVNERETAKISAIYFYIRNLKEGTMFSWHEAATGQIY